MNEMLIIKFFLQGVPESAALIFTALAMIYYRASIRQIFLNAFALTFIIYLLRIVYIFYDVPFGLHSIIGTLAFVIIIHKLTKVSIGVVTFICCIVMFLLIVIEFTISLIINTFFHYNIYYYKSISSDLIWIIIGWPQVIIMWGIGLSIQKYIYPLFLKLGVIQKRGGI